MNIIKTRFSKLHLLKLLILHTISSYPYYDVAWLVMTRGQLSRSEINDPFFILILLDSPLLSNLPYAIVSKLKKEVNIQHFV